MDVLSQRDQVFIDKTMLIIDANIDNEDFGVRQLCRELGVSRSKLHRKLTMLTGNSTSKFIREHRLKRAFELLKKDDLTVSEVSYKVGFHSPSYFSTSFHNFFGISPGDVKFNDDITLSAKEYAFSKRPKRKRILLNYRSFYIFLISLAVLLLALLITYSWNDHTRLNTLEGNPDINSFKQAIAIMPFKVLSDETTDAYFSIGLMSSIQNNLSKIDRLRVISRRSIEVFKDSLMAPSDIAKKLGIDFLLTGTITKQNDSVRIIVNLLNANEDALLFSMVFDEPYEHILAVQSEISTEIANRLNIVMSPSELENMKTIPTDNLDAFNQYLKGRTLGKVLTSDSQKRAIEHFRKAISLDREFALPYAGLAESYRILALEKKEGLNKEIEKIQSLAMQSISIQDNAMAHNVLGTLALTHECNWEKAEWHYKRSLELNSNDPEAYLLYADFLIHVKGQFDASERLLKQAKVRDPYNARHKMYLTKHYFFKRDFETAIQEYRKAVMIDEETTNKCDMGFLTLVKLKRFDEALEEILKLMISDPYYKDGVIELRKIYAEEGIRGVFQYLIEHDVHFETLDSSKYLSVAAYHAFLGNNPLAIELIRSMIMSRNQCIYMIPTFPYFDKLHSEPEFVQLMEQIGLSHVLNSKLKS